jgi:hypothetical protein
MAEPHTTHSETPLTRTYGREIKPWHNVVIYSIAALNGVGLLVSLIVVGRQGVRTPGDLSAKQLARDAAAKERAFAFVRGLGFEPGPAMCCALFSGSAWCTVRVAGSDKTFSLWCSWRHPTCIEAIYPSD